MAGNSRSARRPRVAILGGGFAGLGAARRLADAAADVVIVDRNQFHTFQPLLYQLATGLVEPDAVCHSLHELLERQPNAKVRRSTVVSVDLDSRQVHFDDLPPLTYDYLVYALGAEADLRGTAGAAENSLPIYTMANADRLRRRVATQWESAERDPVLVEDGALNIVVVGGGTTGVETAGALAELYRQRLPPDHPAVAAAEPRVTLVEAQPRLLPAFATRLQTYAKSVLTERAVDVHTGRCVTAVSPTQVTLDSGHVIRAHTVVWAGGIRGAAVARTLGVDLEPTGRVPTDAHLRVPGHPEVFVVGDAAAIGEADSTLALPQLATVALQSGRHAGEEISRMIARRSPRPFSYQNEGMLTAIGRSAACVQLPDGGTVLGRRAQLAWLTVHMALLPTGDVRSRALADWAGAV